MVDVEQLVLTPEEDEAAGDVLYGVSVGRLPLSALDQFAGRPKLADAVARARKCGEQIEVNDRVKREEWEVFLASRKPKDNFRRRIGKGPSFILPEPRQDHPRQAAISEAIPEAQTAPEEPSTIEKIVADIPIQARQVEERGPGG